MGFLFFAWILSPLLPLRPPRPSVALLSQCIPNSSQPPLRNAFQTHHSPPFSHLTYHSTTHQHQSPYLLITARLLITTSLLTPHLSHLHRNPISHTPLITAAPLLITTHHRSISHYDSSQLHFSHLTSQPHLSHPHLSHYSSHHHSSQLYFSHLTHHTTHLSHHLSDQHSSQLHFSHRTHHIITAQLITAPWSADVSRLPFTWQAQYTEPPGGVAARVVAAGVAAAFRVTGAVHRASWRSCGARGRRWKNIKNIIIYG